MNPVRAGQRLTWELSDLPAWEGESLAEEPADHAPMLIINLTPPPSISAVGVSLQDWTSASGWLAGQSRGRTPSRMRSGSRPGGSGHGGGSFE